MNEGWRRERERDRESCRWTVLSCSRGWLGWAGLRRWAGDSRQRRARREEAGRGGTRSRSQRAGARSAAGVDTGTPGVVPCNHQRISWMSRASLAVITRPVIAWARLTRGCT